jgi:hypothetical protein
MGGLFKNPNVSYKGISKLLQDARVKEGGRFMEGYATYLEKEYVKNGFRPVARLKFNEEYAPEGWDAPNSSLRTKPDVVFFAYDPTGKYEVGEGEYFEDYDEAYNVAKNYGVETKAANAESIEQMLQSEEYADVDTKLLKAARLVSKALPKTKIYLHKTTDAYNAGIARAAGMTKEQVANEEGQSSGEYVNGEIHINLEIADATTVYHEAFHDIFMKKAFSSNAAIDMANGLRRIVSDKQLIEKLDKFISNYESAEQSEEFLAELTGIIAAAETELSTTKLHAFKQLINEIAKKLGLPAIFGPTASRQDVLDFINTMSRKLRTGEKIEIGSERTSERKKRISPETSSNYANLTEDGKGNFVFYHVGGNNFETIKRGSGGTLATSKGEANAIGKVGGIAQYYTRPEDGESMVNGTSKYIVKVEQGKVYDFNTDPDNLFEQAKERFETEYPGAAFDANTQLAYITKIANEQGYDMVVADWNGKTRAQTTNEMAPDDVQVSDGNKIVKPFNEEYLSNTAKGYESVIPESKISKLEKLFDKIYKVRNAEGKYDALYSLGQDYGKMSTEEISSLILNSDLSEEIKGEYNDIMSYEPGVRSSRKKRKAPTAEQQIAKAVRDSKMDFKNKQRAIAALMKDMVKAGKIKTKQGEMLVDKFAKLNVDNPITVGRYLAYAEKLMNDADYDSKLKIANANKSRIKKLSKSKSVQASISTLAKTFSHLEPSMVDDIDLYNEMSEKLINSLKPTRSLGGDVSYRQSVVIGEMADYMKTEQEAYEAKRKAEMLDTYKSLVDAGLLDGSMTYDQMKEAVGLYNDEVVTKDSEKLQTQLKAVNKERFYRTAIVAEAFFDKSELTPAQLKMFKGLIAMDIDKLSVKDGYAAVEALDNLITNGIFDGIESIIKTYNGITNAEVLASKVKPRDLKLYGSKWLGRFTANEGANLKIIADSIFGGIRAGESVLTGMGLNDFESGIAKATKQANDIINEYGEKFAKTKPNGESFRSAKNAYERGMYADLKRTVAGTAEQQQAEFERVVGLIRNSIEDLSKGSKDEKRKAIIYQEIFDKFGLDKTDATVLDVETKVAKENRGAVDFWIKKWSEKYSQLADVSLSVYNTMLGNELNYTPVKLSSLDRTVMTEKQAADMISKNGSFSSVMNFTDTNKSGVLIESTKPTKVIGRYLDLDFDMINASAMKAALIDIETAGSVRQVKGFLTSEAFKGMIDSAKDMKMFVNRVNTYITRAKGKEFIGNDAYKDLNKVLNVLSTFGTSKALGSLFMPVKQVVPVGLNTMINAGTPNLNIRESVNPEFNEWYQSNGISTANRGAEATSAIESANKYLDKIPDSFGSKAIDVASKINEVWIKIFLSNPDIFIARASWITYYKKSLKEQGISTDIDWINHKKNEKAANYATHMVDRQQSVSDTAMAGDIFATNNSIKKIIKNVVLPFASFSINQKQRMYSDIRTWMDKNATDEDRKSAIASLAGTFVEMSTYQVIGWSIRYYIYQAIAQAIAGYEEPEEDKEKSLRYSLQYSISSFIKDVFSIAPVTDYATLEAFDYLANWGQDLAGYMDADIDKMVKESNQKRLDRGEEEMTADEERKFREKQFDENRWRFEDFEKEGIDLGTISIAWQKAGEWKELASMAATGKFEKVTDYGTETRYIRPEDMKAVKAMAATDFLFLAGMMPVEEHAISSKAIKYIKKKSMTEVEHNKYEEVKKELGNVSTVAMGLISTRRKTPAVISELEWIKREGGLNEDQSKEYLKVLKKNGEVTPEDLRRIKKGS